MTPTHTVWPSYITSGRLARYEQPQTIAPAIKVLGEKIIPLVKLPVSRWDVMWNLQRKSLEKIFSIYKSIYMYEVFV